MMNSSDVDRVVKYGTCMLSGVSRLPPAKRFAYYNYCLFSSYNDYSYSVSTTPKQIKKVTTKSSVVIYFLVLITYMNCILANAQPI